VRNHADAVLACDFFVTITAMFRTLYVFVVLDVGTRRIVHWNATEHPTAEWTVQQFRAVVPGDQPQRFLIHDRDSIYSSAVDGAVRAMGLKVLRTPVHCPQANAFCERLIATIRRECLDWVILLNDRHLRAVLREWVAHYNQGRLHASLGPGIPDRPPGTPARQNGHRIPDGHRVMVAPILAGLHHEYRLERLAGVNRESACGAASFLRITGASSGVMLATSPIARLSSLITSSTTTPWFPRANDPE
jgi:putative transposase